MLNTCCPSLVRGVIFVVVALQLLAGDALAQTGPQLLLKPFPRQRAFESRTDVVFLGQGETDNAGADFRLTLYEGFGRARLFPGQRSDPRVGYSLDYLDIASDDPALPQHLIDHSLAFGMGVFDVEGWLGGLTVGVGYAGDSVYGDANAWYYMATLAVGREIDETSQIGVVLDYNGNRSIFPDVPLPGFQYRKRIDPTLLLGVGFPVTSLEWKPSERVTVELNYSFPDRLNARADCALTGRLGLFAEYASRTEAFHLDELPDNRRLIYEQERVEAGVRWEPFEHVSLIVAGGYAFDQEFNVGFDVRAAPNLADPSDEPYVRVGLEVRF